jgi:putative ABC transport system substrate-binding protein
MSRAGGSAEALELLHEALLIDSTDPNAETTTSDLRSLAHSLGVELHVLNASSGRDFDAVFAKLNVLRAGGLVIGASALFTARRKQPGALTLRHVVPMVSESHEFVAAGGLAKCGGSLTDAYRLAGVVAGRILKGEKAWRAASTARHER